jgi:hypothetical protein
VPVYGDRYLAISNADYTRIEVKRSDITNANCVNILTRVTGSATPVTPTPTPTPGTGTGTVTSPGTTTSPDLSTCPAPTTGDLLGVGKFDATGTPVMMDTGATEGYVQPDSSHYARYGIIKAQGTVDKYDIWLILDPTSSLFASSLKGSFATLHYIAPTSASANAAAAALPLTRSMTAADSSATARQWKYGQVRIPSLAGMGLRFSFTYQLTTSDKIMTPTFFFQPADAPAVTPTPSPNTGGGGSTGGTLTAQEQRLARWLGSFRVDSRCVPNENCCCAVGDIVAEAITGSTTLVRIRSRLDGSQTCGGMTDVTGDFTLTSDYAATYNYPDTSLTLSAVLSSDTKELQFSNNMYTCKSYAARTTTTALPSAGGSSVPATTAPTSSAGGSVQRNQFVGEWRSDNSCTPSSNCCCMVGSMNVLLPENARSLSNFQEPTDPSVMSNPNALYAYGQLDGGIACFRRTDMAGTCVIDSGTFGQCKLEGINFNATLSGSKLSITNSMYRSCVTVVNKVTKTSAASDVPAPVIRVSPFMLAIYAALVALGIALYLGAANNRNKND